MDHTMRFELAPGQNGIVNKFVGLWRIKPHPLDPEHSSLSSLEQVRGGGLPAAWTGCLRAVRQEQRQAAPQRGEKQGS